MPAQKFIARVAGKLKQITATIVSAGAADADKIPALGSNGRLDLTVMPVGIGPATQSVVASEALGAGKFVNLWSDAGTLKARLADNSNGRPANGFVVSAVSSAASALVYPLDSPNTALSGLTVGGEYWLGTAGGVIATPLDAASDVNTNRIDQYLGLAKSATELITEDDGYVVL